MRCGIAEWLYAEQHLLDKGRPKRTWKMQVGEERVKVGLSREDTLCPSMSISLRLE